MPYSDLLWQQSRNHFKYIVNIYEMTLDIVNHFIESIINIIPQIEHP